MNSLRLPDGLWPVIRDGVRARLLLSTGTLVLTVLAVGSAVLGPSFASAVTNSLIITRLQDAPGQLTGLSWEFAPAAASTTRTTSGLTDYKKVMEDAAAAVNRVRPDTHLPETLQYETTPISAPGISTTAPTGAAAEVTVFNRVDVKLLAKDGACEHLRITGSCPTRPGDILMLVGDAAEDDLQIGDTIRLGPPLQGLRLVGTYLTPAGHPGADLDYWFDIARFRSLPVQVYESIGVRLPRRPAPYVTVETTLARIPVDDLLIRADSRLNITPDLRVEDFAALLDAVRPVTDPQSSTTDPTTPATTADALDDEQANPPSTTTTSATGTLTEVSLNDLQALTDDIASERAIASSTVAPAVLSVILVALALLSRLMTAAADLRVPEIALASLRGAGNRRTWTLALAEPLTLLAIATPLGLATGVASSWLLARLWLVPGLPLPLPWLSWVAAAVVTASAAFVAVLATASTLRRTLAMMLANVKRPGRGPRAVRVGSYALIALAIVIPLSALTGGRTQPDATDLILPVLLGVAAGIIATRLTSWLAKTVQNRRRGSIAGYVAVRALARRREATVVIVPLSVAVAVCLFGSGIYGAAASWRASVAATEAPAAYVYDTHQSMTATIDLTHDLDPDGKWLMAAADFNTFRVPWTVIDAPRLAQVATWSNQWTDEATGDISRQLSPSPIPTITGSEVSLTVEAARRDTKAVPTARAPSTTPVTVELVLRPFGGSIRQIYLKTFTRDHTAASASVPCPDGCHLLEMNLGGGAASPADLAPAYTIGPLAADGTPQPQALNDGGWVPTPVKGDDLQSARAVEPLDGLLRVDVDRGGGLKLVRLASGAIPPARPVIVGINAVGISNSAPSGAMTDNLLPPTTEAAAVSESIPFIGPRGVLADYTMATQGQPLDEDDWNVHILANANTPNEVQDALAARGITLTTTNADVTRRLNATAYALAIRLYGITAALVLLMALAGLVITTAVQLPGRRADAASMRVIGVHRRSVMAITIRETGIVLGSAAIAGALAGLAAQLVVLRTLTLGSITDEVTSPRLLAVLDPKQVALSAAVAIAVLITATVTSATFTVKGAHGGSLREQGR